MNWPQPTFFQLAAPLLQQRRIVHQHFITHSEWSLAHSLVISFLHLHASNFLDADRPITQRLQELEVASQLILSGISPNDLLNALVQLFLRHLFISRRLDAVLAVYPIRLSITLNPVIEIFRVLHARTLAGMSSSHLLYFSSLPLRRSFPVTGHWFVHLACCLPMVRRRISMLDLQLLT